MSEQRNIYGEVNNRTNLKKVFQEIRQDVESAKSRPSLTELYKRAGYLITLSHAPSWEKKFGKDVQEIRKLAESEFSTTARAINRRAREIGTDADYDEKWGE